MGFPAKDFMTGMTYDELSVNSKYKDRLFCLLFGDEKYKQNALSLYNAINGTKYSDVNDIEITTLSDVIYIRMKNDVSILLDGKLSLWEQQSTYNPNMPLRGLQYFAQLYEKYIANVGISKYSRKLIKVPTPQYIVFYNGTEKRPWKEVLHLSDAFTVSVKEGVYEWSTIVYNINTKEAQKALSDCTVLFDYMELINTVRKHQKKIDIKHAVKLAIDECINRGILTEFLVSHRAEVLDMMLNEYNEEEFKAAMKEEGFAEGKEEAKSEIVLNLINKGKSLDEIAELLDYDIDFVKSVGKKISV